MVSWPSSSGGGQTKPVEIEYPMCGGSLLPDHDCNMMQTAQRDRGGQPKPAPLCPDGILLTPAKVMLLCDLALIAEGCIQHTKRTMPTSWCLFFCWTQ